VTYQTFDVVVVPFPFTDRTTSKRRPALVLSDEAAFNARSGNAVLAMITSAAHSEWPLDVMLDDYEAAGLPSPSKVRMKIFTLDQQLILRRIGALGSRNRQEVAKSIRKLLKAFL